MAHTPKLSEIKEPVLQKAKKNYVTELDYRTYRLANKSSKLDETVSSYIDKLVKTVKRQMMAHLFEPMDTISIFGFLATSKLACDWNGIHERAAMCGHYHITLVKS